MKQFNSLRERRSTAVTNLADAYELDGDIYNNTIDVEYCILNEDYNIKKFIEFLIKHESMFPYEIEFYRMIDCDHWEKWEPYYRT